MTDIFSTAAQEYDEWFDRHASVYRSELAAVRTFLPKQGRGLEIGVGTGRFAAPLGIKEGVEPARAMAELARKRGLQVYEAYAEALPFADESFDFILMVTVICFLPDPVAALAEASRVLRPRGCLVIGMIDRDSPLGQVYEAKKDQSKFYREARFYSASQVMGWLARLGYEKIQSCQTLFQDLQAIAAEEPVREHHGQGGFVVISAQKPALA
jgi:SAM-dependent methyltransferase